jgi:hypothetical protein
MSWDDLRAMAVSLLKASNPFPWEQQIVCSGQNRRLIMLELSHVCNIVLDQQLVHNLTQKGMIHVEIFNSGTECAKCDTLKGVPSLGVLPPHLQVVLFFPCGS